MNTYDLAFIGSGIACSMTLCELAARLQSGPPPCRTLRVAIIEREPELWNGVPYGRRSTAGALTFQSLQEFLDEPERSHFIAWLHANLDSWLGSFTGHAGVSAAQWIADNQAIMESGRWKELYLPRFLFGRFVSECTARAVAELSRSKCALVSHIRGEAVDVAKVSEKLHEISVKDASGGMTEVHAARVVLAVGSPPQRRVHDSDDAAKLGHTHITDIYSPAEDINLHTIQRVLTSASEKALANVLVIGSNASALEVLYLIKHRVEIRKLVHSIAVMSYSGMLPYRICERKVDFDLIHLDSLTDSVSFDADALMRAIACDIRRAEALELNIADLRDPVAVAVSRLTPLMHVSEQKRFVCEHGSSYSRLMRRAGPDTCNAAEELVRLGILSTIKGEFRRLEPHPLGRGLMSAVYMEPGSSIQRTCPIPFAVSINCCGFQELDLCTSPLINNLIARKLCSVNSTKRGFTVSEDLEASPGVYVIGPLLAGNFNDKVRLWHVESASRISGLSKLLAEVLMRSLPAAVAEVPSLRRSAGLSSDATPQVHLPAYN